MAVNYIKVINVEHDPEACNILGVESAHSVSANLCQVGVKYLVCCPDHCCSVTNHPKT